MALRTNSGEVREILLEASEGGAYNDLAEPSLLPFVRSASVVIDRVNTCAAEGGYTLTTDELRLMEAWLAAHAYAMTDQVYAENKTGNASAKYGGQLGMQLQATKYGQMALTLDPSGCLLKLTSGPKRKAGVRWLGKPPSDQIDYVDRD